MSSFSVLTFLRLVDLYLFCVLVYVVLFLLVFVCSYFIFFFKQKTAYEMRISDWSSDVCSSDLQLVREIAHQALHVDLAQQGRHLAHHHRAGTELGRASCRERVCQYV